MGVITYDSIAVSGVDFLRLMDLEITQNINTHSSCVVRLEVTKEQGEAAASLIEQYVIISSRAKGQTGVLFYGVAADAVTSFHGGYYELKLALFSTSCLLDREKSDKTYSNSQQTVLDLMEDAAGGKAMIDFHVTDRPIGRFTLRYQETAWEFIKRLASVLYASVTANITTKVPVIHIGMAASQPTETDETVETYLGKEDGSLPSPLLFNNAAMNGPQQKTTFVLGEPASVLNWSGTTTIRDGILTKTSVRMDESSYRQEPIENSGIAGLIVTGIVQEVKKNLVKVFFDQIDESFDASCDQWFEYSTAYSSEGGPLGSGFYFMPEAGDRVRVYFPTSSAGEGLAFASVTVSPLKDPAEMKWRSPGGQELLFTKDGLRIAGRENSIFIDLSGSEDSNYGIRIVCDKDIRLVSEAPEGEGDSAVMLYAEDSIYMYADKQIKLETDSTVMEIDQDKICMNAEYVYLADQ